MSGQAIVVTGANGFVGRHLCRHLASKNAKVTACVRPTSDTSSLDGIEGLEVLRMPERAANDVLEQMFAGADAVVHLSARVHVMQETSADPLAAFRRVNVATTERLACTAARAGVRRFLYLSSIKVNGEQTVARSFTADDAPGYLDPYGQSKWEAEQRLEQIATAHGMEWVVIRPPLVYGPDVRGNFLALMKCLQRGVPLPLGLVKNHRSMVSVYNLIDLLQRVLHHPSAAGHRFLVKDGEDVSTVELVRRLAHALEAPARLLPVPPMLLLASGRLLHQYDAVKRLCTSLVVDAAKTTELLQWQPPMSLDAALGITCSWFQAASKRVR